MTEGLRIGSRANERLGSVSTLPQSLAAEDPSGGTEDRISRSSGTSLPELDLSDSQIIRVFYLVDSLNFGGTEQQAVEVARRLDARRYRVTVGCLRQEGPLLESLRQAGIPVVEFRPG